MNGPCHLNGLNGRANDRPTTVGLAHSVHGARKPVRNDLFLRLPCGADVASRCQALSPADAPPWIWCRDASRSVPRPASQPAGFCPSAHASAFDFLRSRDLLRRIARALFLPRRIRAIFLPSPLLLTVYLSQNRLIFKRYGKNGVSSWNWVPVKHHGNNLHHAMIRIDTLLR